MYDTESGSDQSQGKPNEDNAAAITQLLASIVNENGEQKYKTVEEALKGAANAQSFISTLKTEKAAIEAQLKERQSLEELLGKRDESKADDKPGDTQIPAGITAEQVVEILRNEDQKKVAEANANYFADQAKATFGAEFKDVVNAKCKELGLARELAIDMANTSPKALLKLLGIESKVKPDITGKGTVPQPSNDKPTSNRFDPFKPKANSIMSKWQASGERVKDRLGQN